MTDGITVVKIGGSTLGNHDTTLEDWPSCTARAAIWWWSTAAATS